MATVIVPSSTEPSSSKDVMKKDKKGKKDKKEKKEKKEKHVEMSAETSNLDTEAAETKEERTARKEAKKLAKAAQTGNTSLTTTKSEVEVDKLLSETAPDKPKADKKKRKHEDTTTEDDQAVKEGVTLGEESEKKKSKNEKKEKKAKGQVAEPETEAASTAPVESQDLSVPPTKKPKKEKKPKLDREKIQAKEDHVDQALRAAEATRETGEGEDSNMTGEDGPSKKRKKNNDGELDSEDIYADEALSDGAKKAIVYALQFTLSQKKAEGSSTPWKFNKAKQNWLIRHIWIEEEIPEKYVNLALSYLKTIQGLGRANMIDLAKKNRDAPPPEPLPAPEAPAKDIEDKADAPAPEASAEETEPAKGVRFNAEPEVKVIEDTEAKKKHEVSKDRAERLLKAMGAR